MTTPKVYQVRLENGCSVTHLGTCDSLSDAPLITTQSLLSCVSQLVKPENLVQPTVAREFGACALCGIRRATLYKVELSMGDVAEVCEKCMGCVVRKSDQKDLPEGSIAGISSVYLRDNFKDPDGLQMGCSRQGDLFAIRMSEPFAHIEA